MRRILVIGCSGGGKSTFARKLSNETGLPMISLDAEFWRPGWVATAREPWRMRLAKLAADERWIMDGTFDSSLDLRLPRADTLIWFDLPRWRCVARIIKRITGSYGRVRPEMAPGCPERFDPSFLQYVWNFERDQTPAIRTMIAQHGGHLDPVMIRRDADAAWFLDSSRPSS